MLLRQLTATGRPNASDAAEWRTVIGNRTAQLEAMRGGALEYTLTPPAWATAPNARGPFYDTVEVGARGACTAAYLRGKAKREKREGSGRSAKFRDALSSAAELGKDLYGKVTSQAYARPGGGDAAALAANCVLTMYQSVELANALLADGSGGFRRDLGFPFLYELHTGSLRLALVPADAVGAAVGADRPSGAGSRLASILQRSSGRRTWQASNVEMCVLRLLEFNPSVLNAVRIELTEKGVSVPGVEAVLYRACGGLYEQDATLRDGDGHTWPAALGSGLLRHQELSQRFRRGTWSTVHKRDLTLVAPLKARANVSRARARSMACFGATTEGLHSAFTADDVVAFTTTPLLPIGVDDFVATETRASLGLAAIVSTPPFDLRDLPIVQKSACARGMRARVECDIAMFAKMKNEGAGSVVLSLRGFAPADVATMASDSGARAATLASANAHLLALSERLRAVGAADREDCALLLADIMALSNKVCDLKY